LKLSETDPFLGFGRFLYKIQASAFFLPKCCIGNIPVDIQMFLFAKSGQLKKKVHTIFNKQ